MDAATLFLQLGVTSRELVIASICSVTLWFFSLAVYRVFLHPLRKYPGPLLNRITEYPFVLAGIKGELPYYTDALFKKYGPVVRIGPNNLGFIKGSAWKDIYDARHKDQFEKAYEYYRETEDGPISMVNAGHAEHDRLRRWVAPRFSERGIRDQETMIRGYVDLLVRRLHENCGGGQTALDLRDWYNFCTFDIIGKFAFSSDFGCLESSRYHPWVRLVVFQQREIEWITEMKRQGLTFVVAIIKKIFAKHKQEFLGYTEYGLADLISTIVQECVGEDANERHRQKLNERIRLGSQSDVMEGILNNKDGMKLDTERLAQNSTLFIAAGSETTATLLTATTYFLLTHPVYYEKVVSEVRSSFSDATDITLVSVSKLSWMLACLKESNRVFPVVPSWLPRRLVKGNAVIAGDVVPQGTVVATWPMAANHSELNFSHPDEFHPERFLGDSRFASDDLSSFEPFSYGHADCLGRNLAYAEMRFILASILLNFDLRLAEDSTSRSWPKGQKAYIIWRKPELNVYLSPVN